jgi:hypothetical protein
LFIYAYICSNIFEYSRTDIHILELCFFYIYFRLDCLRKVLHGQADFGVFEAEDIIVASSYKNADVLITNEIRRFNSKFINFLGIDSVKKIIKSRIS